MAVSFPPSPCRWIDRDALADPTGSVDRAGNLHRLRGDVMRGVWLILAAALALGACEKLPTPFKDEHAKQELTAIPASPRASAIVVAPPEGGPLGEAGPMADALVERLQALGLPATGDYGMSAALLLEGRYIAPNAISWRLAGPDGPPMAEFLTTGGMQAVDMTVDRLRLIYRLDDAAIAAPVDLPPQSVAVLGVDGAPGDGNTALERAMRELLVAAKVPLQENPALADIALKGVVDLAPSGANIERIRIAWILLTKDGAELGRLEQNNAIPAGSLNGRWGGTAYDASLAVFDSLRQSLDVLDEARRRQAEALQ